ncbi:MAG: LytTR family DNA-binding domain-containing protein [Saprospiraceae bacterium]
MNLKTMIVDDDAMARASIQALCKKAPLIDVVAICDSAEAAIEMLKKQAIDLILLDIEMQGMSGIDLLNELVQQPQVIFITSERKYAYEAFQYQVTDYLQKPIKMNRFQEAIEKVQKVQTEIERYKKRSTDIYIKVEGRYVRLSYDEILFFEYVGDYVRIATTKGRFIIHSTLKSIDQKLKDARFLKVHRSFIINLDKIKDIEENSLVIEGAVIPISRANKPILLSRLNFL